MMPPCGWLLVVHPRAASTRSQNLRNKSISCGFNIMTDLVVVISKYGIAVVSMAVNVTHNGKQLSTLCQ